MERRKAFNMNNPELRLRLARGKKMPQNTACR
jgi:hypothetical protein